MIPNVKTWHNIYQKMPKKISDNNENHKSKIEKSFVSAYVWVAGGFGGAEPPEKKSPEPFRRLPNPPQTLPTDPLEIQTLGLKQEFLIQGLTCT